MTNSHTSYFVYFTICFLVKINVICAKYGNQPKIHTPNGDLMLEAAYDRNITLRFSHDSALLLNGVDIMEKIKQRYTPTILDPNETKQVNVPSAEVIRSEVNTLNDDIEGLSRRFSFLQNRTRSRVQLRAIRRSLGRLQRLSGRLLVLEQNVDKNECAEVTEPCKNGGTCYDSYNGFHCECTAGWTGKTCEEDEDECYIFAGTDLGCQNNAVCVNTPGSYRCECAKGYVGAHCRLRRTVCQQYQSEELCGHGICVPANNPQGYTCVCNQGWARNVSASANSTDSLMCDVDVNECEESRNPCHGDCVNLPGSFKCAPCPAGYTGNGVTCVDVDECAASNGGCSLLPKVRCINTEGSYRCGNCPAGWVGDGRTCELAPSNSCDAEKICHPQAKCEYISGIATCTCAHGMFGHGFGPDGCHSTPITESCDNHICQNNGTCIAIGRSTRCLCPLGYSGALCEAVDGCHPNPCENDGSCKPLANKSFKCFCNRGTTGKRCEVLRSVCNTIQRSSAGELSYPSDDAPEYAAYEKCAWIIRTHPSKILNLTFTKFDVQEDADCSKDWLQIHDGNSLASQSIGRFCGHELPLGGTIISSQHQLFFWFRSDNVTNRPGFHMTWHSEPHMCGESKEVGAQGVGVIRSPGYPGKTAPRRECQWDFSAPYGYRFVLRIYEINLGSSQNCTGDTLKIYDSDLLLKEFCSSTSPPALRTSSNKVTIHFHTDYNDMDSSFQLHYEVESSVPHCGGAYTDPSGLIVGPTDGSVCLFIIQQPMDTQIQLDFLEMEPFGVENCNLKSIEVFDGQNDEGALLATICNGKMPGPLVSTNNFILIRYKNKLQNENHAPLFKAKYTRVCEFRFFGPDAGQFTSPNYPLPYAEKLTCTYHIYGPAETVVHANFTDFSIAEEKSDSFSNSDQFLPTTLSNQTADADGLMDDSKTYVDVHLSESNRRRYVRGNPMELLSELNKMTIVFHAALNPSKARGIRVEYSFESIPCGGVYTEAKGSFNSGMRVVGGCKYIFEAPKGHDVYVSFGTLTTTDNSRLLIFGNSTGGKDYLLKNISSSMLFDDTLHFDVITIIAIGKMYLVEGDYEFIERESVCGGNFTSLYGVIKSPGWPGSYAANLDCVWIVTAPLGHKIELSVQNFTLEPNCVGDKLEIRNGMTSTSPLIGRYCGNDIPARIPSFANGLYLRFTSDNSVEGAGFHISWEQTETGCGGKLTSFKGSIHPPFVDYNRYSYNQEVTCDWTIHVALGSSVIINVMPTSDLLTFCHSNRLRIYEGSTASKTALHFNCSQAQKSGRMTMTSASNEVLVVYSPLGDDTPEFILEYETNCKMVLDHVRGVIESPNFPELYPEHLNCNWDIKAGVNNKLKLAFSHLSLEAENMECEHDYVEVVDMKNEDVLKKYRLCAEIPPPINSDGNRLVVRFVTDYSTNKNGFRAEYSRIGCGEVLTQEFASIQSPNFPYSIDLNCDWYIEVPAGKQVVFNVYELQMDADNQDCSTDVILAKETKNSNHTLFKECSTQNNAMSSIFTSPANQLYLNFRSGPTRTRKYFKGLYHTKTASCGGVFKGTSGVILSPNYPQNTTQELHCKWEISVPSSYGIVVKFRDFKIIESHKCSEAYLKLSKISGATETFITQICGSNIPVIEPIRDARLVIEFMSKGPQTGGKFAFEFAKQCGSVITDGSGYLKSNADESCAWTFNVTDGSLISLNILQMECYCSKEDKKCPNYFAYLDTPGQNVNSNETTRFCEEHRSNLVFEKSLMYILASRINFYAKYSTVQHSCGGIITSPRGSLVSPYYPASYPPNVECTWTIMPKRGNTIELQIVEMDIAKSEHCNEDYLEISTIDTYRILGVFCGNELPDSVLISHQMLAIRFHSSAGSTGNGFKLNWNYAHLNEIENATKGVIESPPLEMARQAEEPFAWRILVERNSYVLLMFDQYIGGLNLFDGFDDTALPVAIPDSPWRFVSSSNVVFLKTDNANLQHFSIKWNATRSKVIDTNTTISKCHSDLFIKSLSRTIVTSPGYPRGYEDNLQCDWIFKPESAFDHVVCEIYDARLEVSGGCSADYLQISTSTDLVEWHEMEKLCNSSEKSFKPFMVRHGTPHIKLNFVSDLSINGTGFSAVLKTKCGSNLTESVGFIPGDRLMFEYDCVWQIKVKQTKRVRLQMDFPQIVASNSNDCTEYALIYDGMDEHAPLLPPGKICNPQNVTRLVINSTSNYVTIKYNLSPPRPLLPKRWNLTYREFSECNEEYRLIPDASVVIVSSPNYPNIPQPHSECEWRVIAPRGELIQVEFVDRFDMNGRFCSKEFLEIFDGSTSLARSLGRFCRRPPVLKTTQNILYMHYQTDTREPRSGFRARVSISKCGGSYSDANGVILSAGYPNPGSYPSSSQCDYVINMPPDYTIHLVATDIHLPFNNVEAKSMDYLEIIPIGDDAEPIFIYGNTTKGSSFDINANKAIVRFHTFEKNTNYRGFSLKYNRFGDRCNQEIKSHTGESGILTMHFPKRTFFKSFCRWEIVVPKGQRVRLEFLNLSDLKDQNSTRYPTFDVYNDHGTISKVITVGVDNFDPSVAIQSSDNVMLVRIHIPLVDFQFKPVRARYSSDDVSSCPPNIDDDNQSGLIEIDGNQPFFKGNFFCFISVKLNGRETLVFNITSFVNIRRDSAPKTMAPLSFRDQMYTNSYWSNLTSALQPLTQITGSVRMLKTDQEQFHKLRMDYRRHKCGGTFTVLSDVELQSPGAVYAGYGAIMCVWTLIKPYWTERVGSEFQLWGNFTFTDSCDREFVLIYDGHWRDNEPSKKICKDNAEQLKEYTLRQRLTNIFYQSQDFNHAKSNLSLRIRKSIVCGSEVKVGQISSMVELKKDSYKNNQECVWTFFTMPGYFLQMQFFDRFFIENSINCTKDYLEIQRQVDGLWFPLARLCGRVHPDVVNTTATNIRVVWHTNDAVTADGFSFFVRSHCSVTLNVSTAVQQLVGPNSISYGGRRLQCEYIFQSNETDKLINVRVRDVSAPFHRNGQCRSGGFLVSKRDETGSEQTGQRHCEPEFEERAYRYLKLNYDTSLMSKFTIEYAFDTCGGNITTSPTTIRPLQHEQDDRYPDNMNCVWTVTAPVDHSIAIRFKYFDTEQNFDHVSIYTGTKIEADKRQIELSGNLTTSPPTVLVDHNEAVINAVSDVSAGAKGFEAQIVFLHNCNERISLTDGNSPVNLARNFKLNGDEEYMCVYRVSAPKDHRIRIDVKKLLINNSTTDCSTSETACKRNCNTVEVFDSLATQQASMGTLCRVSRSNFSLITSYEDAMLKFKAKTPGTFNFEIILTMEKSVCGEMTDYKLGASEVFKFAFPQNGATSYAPNVHCTWRLRSDFRVQVHFNYIDLQNASQVTGECLDYIEVRGMFGYNRFCGHVTNYTTVIEKYPENVVDITFHSDDTVQGRGVEYVISTREMCNQTYGHLSGMIRYEGVSPQKELCNDTIIVPDNYTLSFYIANLYFRNFDCNKLHFRISDLKTNKTLLDRCYNSYESLDVFTTTNAVRIEALDFSTISIFYVANKKSEMPGCGATLTSSDGYLSNPPYDNRNFSECRWDISVPTPNKIRINFYAFNMGPSSNCPLDNVQLIDVFPDGNEKVIKTLCGSEPPSMITSTSSHVVLISKKSPNFDGTGWNLHYELVKSYLESTQSSS